MKTMIRDKKLIMNLQTFAEGGDGAGEGNGDPEVKVPSFDEFLKGEGMQAEFDRRIQKALNTAKEKWEASKNEELTEAERLAKMTKAEKDQYNFNKRLEALEEREKAVKNGKIEGKPLVTCVHKANVLKTTDGLFKKAFYDVAANYPNINTNDYYVDATAMYLLTQPHSFDVIVTSNLFGDILSDESAGLVGGLGLAPSGNIGDKHGLFEPVHGSAPDIAGKNISNPIAMTLSVAMMLEYLDEVYLANKVRLATEKVLEKGKVLTPDLGGNAKTMDVANEIIKEIELLD